MAAAGTAMAPVSNDTRFAKPDRGGRDVPAPVPARNVQQIAELERTGEALAALNTRPLTQREAEAIMEAECNKLRDLNPEIAKSPCKPAITQAVP